MYAIFSFPFSFIVAVLKRQAHHYHNSSEIQDIPVRPYGCSDDWFEKYSKKNDKIAIDLPHMTCSYIN
jgi:hypothetical protein